MDVERAQASFEPRAKRFKLETISYKLPKISPVDWDLLTHIYPIMDVFELQTKMVIL